MLHFKKYLLLGSNGEEEDQLGDYYNDEEYYNDNAGTDINSIDEQMIDTHPKFVSPSKSVIVNQGDTFKLPCLIDNLPGSEVG